MVLDDPYQLSDQRYNDMSCIALSYIVNSIKSMILIFKNEI